MRVGSLETAVKEAMRRESAAANRMTIERKAKEELRAMHQVKDLELLRKIKRFNTSLEVSVVFYILLSSVFFRCLSFHLFVYYSPILFFSTPACCPLPIPFPLSSTRVILNIYIKTYYYALCNTHCVFARYINSTHHSLHKHCCALY